jgi:DNA excision repair protein ERCC-6-like 2
MQDGSTTASSDDDLDIVQSTRKRLKSARAKNSHLISSQAKENISVLKHGGDSKANNNLCRKALDGRTTEEPPIKIAWSSDEDEKFSFIGKLQSRKRTRLEGKTAPEKTSKVKRRAINTLLKLEVETEDDSDSDTAVPSYLRIRRENFDIQALRQDGLMLPPTYEDIYFSDDDHLDRIEERPNFLNAKPQGKYEDKVLPETLGLIPASIAQWLRDYQISGIGFLHKLFVYQKGGILGDDMGLGKTVQVIGFLTVAFGKTGDERDGKRLRKMRRQKAPWYPKVLIVCPGTLIENWKREFRSWGWWKLDVYHGATKEDALQMAKAGRLEVLITTYTTYRAHKEALNMVEWDCVVADECHMIKGRHSETTKAMNEINALCRIGLTGTAIQNSYDELWTLLNWTNPGKFGQLSVWKETISEPLKLGQSHDATIYQLGRARKTAKALTENLLPEFFLRRTKALIADQLPKKSDRIVFCPLTETQHAAYERFLESEMMYYIKTSSDPCACGSGKKSGWCCNITLPNGTKWQAYVFPAIMNLQKLANHLAILVPQGNDVKEKQEKDLYILQLALPDKWKELYQSRGAIENFANVEFCGKWKVLRKLLKFWHENGDKVLVFSHSIRLLKMLRLLFQNTHYNVSFLDGSMSYEERAQEVNDFNVDPDQFVFLISTKAGGVGLNITAANKVVVMDPNWNPAYDLQAQDRAYRIGQTRDVEVFRLISSGTIEEIVYARQIYKQQQANIGYTASNERRYFKGIQNRNEQKGEIFGLKNLFTYSDKLTLRDIMNKTNVAESRAGVSVLDFDSTQDDESIRQHVNYDENSAMSQLVELVTSGDPDSEQRSSQENRMKKVKHSTKSDPIQVILGNAGVKYTHENSEVIGTSRVEHHLSRKAEMEGWDADIARKQVFRETQSQSQRDRIDREDDAPDSLGGKAEGFKYVFKPPFQVMKRQFCTMAKMYGFDDAVSFALVVESWTQEQRRNCLDRFYAMRKKELDLDDG